MAVKWMPWVRLDLVTCDPTNLKIMNRSCRTNRRHCFQDWKIFQKCERTLWIAVRIFSRQYENQDVAINLFHLMTLGKYSRYNTITIQLHFMLPLLCGRGGSLVESTPFV